MTMTMTENSSNTQAALEFASETTEPRVLTIETPAGQEQVLVTTGAEGVTSIALARDLFADLLPAPPRRKGTLVVHDLASFIAATNRDSGHWSVIFADAPARKLTTILDFDEPGPDREPRWRQDRIEYGFAMSPQLKAWLAAADRSMDQREFAKLMDNRIGDIAPDAPAEGSVAWDFAGRRGIRFATIADLLVFTRTIATKSTTDSEEIRDENTGDVSIQYKKKGDVKAPDGSPIAVPLAFCLRIPVYCGREATEFHIAVRLRYDIGDKGISWRIEIHALDKYLLAGMEEALDVVRGSKMPASPLDDATPEQRSEAAARLAAFVPGCGLPVFMGTAPPPA